MTLEELQIGDKVRRMLASHLYFDLKVSNITEDYIICGSKYTWKFCKKTGMEINEELQWGPQYNYSGSFIRIN